MNSKPFTYKKEIGYESGLVLNEELYRSLCVACDRILLAADSTIERVSIPWLHVVREHHVFLGNYIEVLNPVQ